MDKKLHPLVFRAMQLLRHILGSVILAKLL